MKKRAVAEGIYEDEVGRFWIRPRIEGRRTWRRLHSLKLKFARTEAADLLAAHRRSNSGDCRSPLERGTQFSEIANRYLAAGCPNGLDEPRDEKFIALERWRIDYLEKFYGTTPLNSIKIKTLRKYRDWRVKQVSRGTGARTTEMEWVTLSNVINYAVREDVVDFNYIRSGRPRLRANHPRASSRAEKIQHCRQFAPADGNELNLLAEYFFADDLSQAIGFQMLFEAFTSCRSSEAQKLRMDASNSDEPGFIDGNHLFIARSKHGINPFVLITEELADFLACHKSWHSETNPENPFWFPGRPTTEPEFRPLEKHSLNRALNRASRHLGLPKRTGHGLRSFYCTRRRGEGASEAQIADEMGITSIALLEQVYGGRPPNWQGQKLIRYWPDEAAPAWHRWKRTAEPRQAVA